MSFTVKQARMYAGKTQREMAKHLKINVQTYRKIEVSSKSATIEQAKKISEVTGIPYDEIIFA